MHFELNHVPGKGLLGLEKPKIQSADARGVDAARLATAPDNRDDAAAGKAKSKL